MTLDELLASAHEHEFSDLESIKRLAREAIVLTPTSGGVPSASRSRLGGTPDLPASVAWPQRDGRSLAFIAQIELSSQPKVAAEEGLPREGLLLFFYDAEQSTWGFDPKDAGSFAVIHVPESTPASDATDWPSDVPEHARYRPCSLVLSALTTMGPWFLRSIPSGVSIA